MTRDDVHELHYIVAVENLESIRQRGILSHNDAKRIPHRSIAMEDVQNIRKTKRVPNGLALHDYVNLYFNARNPMLYWLLGQHDTLCVLRVDPNVLDLPGVVIADGNAASKYVRFHPAPGGLRFIDRDTVFAASWKHPHDIIEEWRHKTTMCAEVLVPRRVPARYVMGSYVVSEAAVQLVDTRWPGLSVSVNPRFFFR